MGLSDGQRRGDDTLIAEGLTCAIDACHMGITAEEVAARFGVSRDGPGRVRGREPAARGRGAIAAGLFRDEIVPVRVPQKKGDPSRVDTRRISRGRARRSRSWRR